MQSNPPVWKKLYGTHGLFIGPYEWTPTETGHTVCHLGTNVEAELTPAHATIRVRDESDRVLLRYCISVREATVLYNTFVRALLMATKLELEKQLED